MRVFLAGGTGHVGGAIRRELLSRRHDVSVLTRNPRGKSLEAGVQVVAGNLGDPGPWQEATAGHDACIDAAGLIRERGGNSFRRVVVEGTQNLIDAGRRHDVARFVLISANGVEANLTPYHRTKLEAEALLKQSGLAYTIFRPSVIYGPTDDFTTRFARMMRLGVLPYPGRGQYRLAPVFAGDLASAVAQSLASPEAVNRTYHVCGPENLPYREVLAAIRRASGRRALLLPVPTWGMYALTGTLGWLPGFPATPSMIRMLVRGNECPEAEWVKLLGASPTRFSKEIERYLGRKKPS